MGTPSAPDFTGRLTGPPDSGPGSTGKTGIHLTGLSNLASLLTTALPLLYTQ